MAAAAAAEAAAAAAAASESSKSVSSETASSTSSTQTSSESNSDREGRNSNREETGGDLPLSESAKSQQQRTKFIYNSIPESRIFERNLQIMRMKLNSIEQIRNSSRNSTCRDQSSQRSCNNQKVCNEIFYIWVYFNSWTTCINTGKIFSLYLVLVYNTLI